MGFFISWFLVMFPLVISPSSANIVFAASGVKYGFRNSLFLLVEIDTIFVLQSFIVGFGLGTILQKNPKALDFLQLGGSFYLFYLGFNFLKLNRNKGNNIEKKLGFLDGVLIQISNVKGWILVALMFSLFSNNLFFEENYLMILFLVFMLCLLNVSSHLARIAFGSSVISILVKKEKTQNMLFSLSLFYLAFYFLLDNGFIKSLYFKIMN